MIRHNKLLILLIAVLNTNINFGTIYYPDNRGIPLCCPSNKTSISYDVDKVLVDDKDEFRKFANLFFASDKKAQLGQVLIGYLLNKPTIDNLQKTVTDFDIIDYIAARYPVLKEPISATDKTIIVDRVKEIIAGGKATAVVGLLIKLQERNYPTSLATNRDRTAVDHLIDRKVLPNADHYKVIYTSDFDLQNAKKQNQGELVRRKSKPDHQYYNGLKKELDKEIPERCCDVFIDDKKENVIAAAQTGIIGIHFENFEQLCKDLKELGITVD